jgi:hypothetical protein
MRRASIIAILAVGASCGGGGGSGAPTNGATAYCRSYIQALNEAWARCFGGTASEYAQNSMRFCADLDGLVAKGTIVYDSAKGAACLARLQSALATSCSTEDCLTDGIIGQLDPGAECVSGAECQLGADCVAPLNASPCAKKTCAQAPPVSARIEEGEPCPAGSPPCVDFLGCLPDAPGSMQFVCRVARVGEFCQSDFDCPPDDYCGDVAHTCQVRSAIGAPCSSDQGCAVLAACDEGSHTCVPAGRVGQPCPGSFLGCITGSCGPGPDGAGICVMSLPGGAQCLADENCASGVCVG